MALLGAMWKVSVVRRATPIVAVRPGSIPMMMPNWVAQSASNRARRVNVVTIAWPKSFNPSNIPDSLRKIDEEEVLEHEEDSSRGRQREDRGEHGYLPLPGGRGSSDRTRTSRQRQRRKGR